MNAMKQIEAMLDGKRVSRQRAMRLAELLLQAKEIVIQSHPEPETLRAWYGSNMAGTMLEGGNSKAFDPIGRVRWLREVDAFLEELEGETP